jgi:hypothetical protein
MLGKISQTQKSKYHTFYHVQKLRKKKDGPKVEEGLLGTGKGAEVGWT